MGLAWHILHCINEVTRALVFGWVELGFGEAFYRVLGALIKLLDRVITSVHLSIHTLRAVYNEEFVHRNHIDLNSS